MDKWAKKFGDFEIITWELKTQATLFQQSTTNFRIQFALLKNKIIKLHQPDMVIAERTTSYGFLALYQCKTNSNSTTRARYGQSSVLTN
jgi:hypothetical protein